jgi:hypothetical protein
VGARRFTVELERVGIEANVDRVRAGKPQR